MFEHTPHILGLPLILFSCDTSAVAQLGFLWIVEEFDELGIAYHLDGLSE